MSGRTSSTGSLFELATEQSRLRSHAPFVTHVPTGKELTYGELAETAGRVAAVLARLGVKEGSRVALLAENHWATHVLLVACASLRAMLVPLGPKLVKQEMAALLRHCEPTVVVAQDDKVPVPKPTGGQTMLTLAELLERAAVEPPAPEAAARDAADGPAPLLIVYTSGTSGEPKGVVLTQKNLVTMAEALRDRYELTPDDRFLCVLPFHHMNSLMMGLCLPLATGCSVVIPDLFGVTNAKFYWDLAERHGATVCAVTPSIMSILCHLLPGGRGDKGKRVRLALCGTAPLPAAQWMEFERIFQCAVYQGYGLTETTTWAVSSPLGPRRYDSVGTPLAAEVRIDVSRVPQLETLFADRRGGSARPPEAAERRGAARSPLGEIFLRGPILMQGYYKKPSVTKEVMTEDGFLATGDVGFLDADGHLEVVARKKEIIIRNGVNVVPDEVDVVIREHPEIVDSKTLGTADKLLGEAVVVVCVPKPDVVEAELKKSLRAWTKERLSPDRQPDQFVLRRALPRGATGKVSTGALQKIVSGQATKLILENLTRPKFQHTASEHLPKVTALVDAAVRAGSPLRFLTYWGCGGRSALNDNDVATLERLKEYVDGVAVVPTVTGELTVMCNDLHARLNGHADVADAYFAEVRARAASLGFATVVESELWHTLGLPVDDLDAALARGVGEAAFRERWAGLATAGKLVEQARKHGSGADEERAAQGYLWLCERERQPFGERFAGHVFLTFGTPDLDLCLPTLPVLYLYSWKKWTSHRPWFSE